MAIHFDHISYLESGTPRQQQAYHTLVRHNIMISLLKFDPILVGTIPLDIDIDNSDLDIVCCYKDAKEFVMTVRRAFSDLKGLNIREQELPDTVVANFQADVFEIEIFGQPIPTRQQLGYRHMVIEYKLLQEKGEDFRQQIIELKEHGYKTEPAFAKLLGLEGDAYQALLSLE